MPSQEKTAVPLLDVLMTLREDMTARGRGPYQYIGMPDVDHVTGFIVGYKECLRNLGVEVGTDALFRDWLRDVKQALPGQGWAAAYLEEFHGIGTIDVRRMAGFVDGYRLCLALAGARDEEYPRFERWLHEEKSLPAGQEWPRPFLQACQGDDEQAIHRLLGFAAEFRSASPHS